MSLVNPLGESMIPDGYRKMSMIVREDLAHIVQAMAAALTSSSADRDGIVAMINISICPIDPDDENRRTFASKCMTGGYPDEKDRTSDQVRNVAHAFLGALCQSEISHEMEARALFEGFAEELAEKGINASDINKKLAKQRLIKLFEERYDQTRLGYVQRALNHNIPQAQLSDKVTVVREFRPYEGPSGGPPPAH